jgi:hypothetical protein
MSAGIPGPVQGPVATPAAGYVDIYADAVDPNQVLPPEQRSYYSQHGLTPFPTWAAVLLSVFTGGLFSVIYYMLLNDKLPQVKPDDPSAGKAIGFMFIPFYNIYWQFFAWHRIVDRINFQYKLRGHQPPINRGMVTTTLILLWVGIITLGLAWIGALVTWIIVNIQTQDAINGLAEGRV